MTSGSFPSFSFTACRPVDSVRSLRTAFLEHPFRRAAALHVQAVPLLKSAAPHSMSASGYHRPARAFHKRKVLAALIAIALATAAPATATAGKFEEDGCAGDTREAIATARQALKDDSDDVRAALACLIEAVAALDEKLNGLSTGSIPFDGQIHIPKGWVIAKPPASEAD
jgi:hypothetical protein